MWNKVPDFRASADRGSGSPRCSSCARHWTFGERKILSFVICMQIGLLHKLTSEPRVTPHLLESRRAAGSEAGSSFIVADGSQTPLCVRPREQKYWRKVLLGKQLISSGRSLDTSHLNSQDNEKSCYCFSKSCVPRPETLHLHLHTHTHTHIFPSAPIRLVLCILCAAVFVWRENIIYGVRCLLNAWCYCCED